MPTNHTIGPPVSYSVLSKQGLGSLDGLCGEEMAMHPCRSPLRRQREGSPGERDRPGEQQSYNFPTTQIITTAGQTPRLHAAHYPPLTTELLS